MSTQYIKKLWRILFVGIFSITSIAISSIAQAEGWYGGVGFGNTKMKDAGTALLGTSLDDKDSGWKLMAGYQFHPNAAIELGYIDFGTFTGSGGGFSDQWEATGFSLSMVGLLPVAQQFFLLGKIGFTRWDVDDDFSVFGFPVSANETGTDMNLGVGAQFNFTKQVGARLEWEKFSDVGDDATTGQSDLELISISVIFSFN
jgi:OOP family OmpA-OmpF porin